MFTRVEISEDIDDLNRVVYEFWLNGTDLYLDRLLAFFRESRRHSFKIDYNRSYSRVSQRDYGIKEEPEIDISIQADAVEKARTKIVLKKWTG